MAKLETVQLYELVNKVNKEMSGSIDLEVVDTNSFVALGQAVLSSDNLTTNFTNTLFLRIASTIVSFRKYRTRLKPMIYDDIRWGSVVQKIKTIMPEAVPDEAYDLVDGESVDMYEVKKPKFVQNFFINRTPYSFFVTLQRWQLKRAFINEDSFASLISSIYGEIQNRLEITFENLGYLTIDNFIANTVPNQQIHVVTRYNTETGKSLSPAGAEFDPDFMRYLVAIMNIYANNMTTSSILYNATRTEHHTPESEQIFVINNRFNEFMKTVVQYEAFHEKYVKKQASMVLPYWQSATSPLDIEVTDSKGTEVNMKNIIGVIYDRDALGIYRKEQEVLTTPVNARGRYTNTFYHEEQMWFNDMNENGLVFLLD